MFALADGGLSTPAVYAECDRIRAAHSEQAGWPHESPELLAALAAGDAKALGAALTNDLQPAALTLRPSLQRTLSAGRDFGALGALVSDRARPARSSPPTRPTRRTLGGRGRPSEWPGRLVRAIRTGPGGHDSSDSHLWHFPAPIAAYCPCLPEDGQVKPGRKAAHGVQARTARDGSGSTDFGRAQPGRRRSRRRPTPHHPAGVPATVTADPCRPGRSTEWSGTRSWSATPSMRPDPSPRLARRASRRGCGRGHPDDLLAFDLVTGALSTTFVHALNGQGLRMAASPTAPGSMSR